MKLTYLGTNTLLFNKDNTAILVDPHFTRPGMLRLLGKIRPDPQIITKGMASAGIQGLDGILLTHTHYDHALDCTEVQHQAGGVLYGNQSAKNLAVGAGVDKNAFVQVAPRQAYPIGAFKVCFHPSQHVSFPLPFKWLMPAEGRITRPLHPSTWFWHFQAGRTFAIQVNQALIFGSAGFVPGAYNNCAVETVILGIGGLGIKPRAYLHQLYKAVVLETGAKQVWLSHWDDFFQPLDQKPHPMHLAQGSITRIKALGAQYGQNVGMLEIGKSISIE